MLKKMIMINSAEFDYSEISLEKDIFFAGDNGTGKTSTIVALFYLFSGDNNSRKLGISSDKKTFKEYYFPENKNSFLIYVFEDFFIFMYKQNGEVIKFFSQQIFDIHRVIKEDGSLYPFNDIRTYIRSGSLTYLAKSGDYRDIIYGQSAEYADFAITKIKNYNIFVELFNQTFNVDKSIVDAKSIKRAIQKSLNIEEKNLEFNYQKYMDMIGKFQEQYLFFKKFEKESENIDEVIRLKEGLLEAEKRAMELEGFIVYRASIEGALVKEKEQEEQSLRENMHTLDKQIKEKEHFLNKCRQKELEKRVEIGEQIKQIERLKKRYEPQIIKNKEKLASEFMFAQNEAIALQKELTLLEVGVTDKIEAIDKTIRLLKEKRDVELVALHKITMRQIKEKLKEEFEAKKELSREEKSREELEVETKKERYNHTIEELEAEKSANRQEQEGIGITLQNELNHFMREKEEQKVALQSKRASLQNEALEEEQALQKIVYSKRRLEEKFYDTNLKQTQNLLAKRKEIYSAIAHQKSILFSPKNSFKSYLEQSGLAWEKELYPFMDSKLLHIPKDTLEPELLEDAPLLGLKLNLSTLKQIPTQEEAQKTLEELKKEKRSLLFSYKKKKITLQEEHKEHLKDMMTQEALLKEKQDFLTRKVEELSTAIKEIENVEIPKKREEIRDKKESSLKTLKIKLKEIVEKIEKKKSEIKTLNTQLNSLINGIKSALKEEEKKLNTSLHHEEKKLKQALEIEQNKITKEIEAQQSSKKSITKNDKIEALQSSLTQAKDLIEKAREAKRYLEEYETKKLFMDTLEAKRSSLVKIAQYKSRFEEHLRFKKEKLQKQLESYHQALERHQTEIIALQRGLKKYQHLSLEHIEPQNTERYLVALIDEYSETTRKKSHHRASLRDKLGRLSVLKQNSFIDLYFKMENFNTFDLLSDDEETLEKIYELQVFKEQKLEVHKKATNQEYVEFIKSEIPNKLGSLSHSEDKFQEQVKKINKNLALIDFSIVKEIKIKTEVGNQRSVIHLLNELRKLVDDLSLIQENESLFFSRTQTNQDLQKISNLLDEIKTTLKGGAITLLDTIDLALEFTENGKHKKDVIQIKNESSTGGTILLKMALAVSILGLYTEEKTTTFFLILDEVSRLHSHNQDLLRSFANAHGFRIVFVTPEPIYAKPDEIKYYKFKRREDNRFEVIGLNV